ncbi:energy-coupling factor transporter transmembrane component T [Haloarculaceae archaeon H-GB2-1]|nr:energy-coupling factor transporter transmembrane component T [Haloarculaceae archaeon H-GB1-1]MEA5388275.1 energy-coupling factor transporter transmembrane component T [Haloarculaceae archaeon H-GB11]MEA5406317.1 energy-coupling factor transporter transmembrane component T [Haloarculaceae archaeon H-GB2-1]
MLTYEPDDALAHALDPRSKLCFQVGFAIAAFSHPTPRALAALTALALAALGAARLSPRRVLFSYRFVLLLLAFAPVSAVVALQPPWLVPERMVAPALSSYRVVLVLFVAGAYVRSTPVRESRAAVQRLVPGRTGQLLGVGMGLTLRFFPLLLGDVRRIRTAMDARVGSERSVVDRAGRIAVVAIRRAFTRADRLALALRARCFSWNPTLPELRFARMDYPVTIGGLALALSALV